MGKGADGERRNAGRRRINKGQDRAEGGRRLPAASLGVTASEPSRRQRCACFAARGTKVKAKRCRCLATLVIPMREDCSAMAPMANSVTQGEQPALMTRLCNDMLKCRCGIIVSPRPVRGGSNTEGCQYCMTSSFRGRKWTYVRQPWPTFDTHSRSAHSNSRSSERTFSRST